MDKRALSFREVTMRKAIEWARARTMSEEQGHFLYEWPEEIWNSDVMLFTDGSVLAVCSEWSGPYSEVTPDIDADPPRWWIGEPVDAPPPGERGE